MDMWCLDGIGRGSWDRDMSRIAVRAGPFPPSRDEARVCYASLCGVPGSSPVRICVAVVVVAVAAVVAVVVAVVVADVVVVVLRMTQSYTIYAHSPQHRW